MTATPGAATPPTSEPWVSTHFGPAVSDVGGMSSVLASYLRFNAHGHRLMVVASYASTARLWGLGLYVAALRTLLRTPRTALGVVHVHVSRRGSFVREGSLALIAHLRGCPTCATVHGSRFGVRFGLYRPLYLFVLRRVDRVVVLSPETAALLAPHLPPDAVTTIPNPVDVPARPTAVSGTGPLVVFAGQLSRRKGFDVLLDAWETVRRRVPGAQLEVAGPRVDVPFTPDASSTHLGVVARDDVHALLDRARVAVLPSRHEAMPIFVLEAMAAGRPVVSTPVAAIPSMVDGAGIIVPIGDRDALAGAIVRLLEDPEEAARLGRIGRDRVLAGYGIPAVAEQLGQLYSDVTRPDAHRVAA